MKRTKFIITEILDLRKQGSEVEKNKVFIGELKKRSGASDCIHYTDNADCEWVFYVGSTCELIPNDKKAELVLRAKLFGESLMPDDCIEILEEVYGDKLEVMDPKIIFQKVKDMMGTSMSDDAIDDNTIISVVNSYIGKL